MNEITLISIIISLTALITIITVIYIIRSIKNRKIKKTLENLDIEKNKIDSAPIIPELSKIESYLKNEKLEIMYNEWKERYDSIKYIQIPRIADMLLEADFTLSQADYKSTLYKIAKLEMEIYKVRTNAEFLLGEIMDVTSSEERNRALVTKLKTKYRELYEKFTASESEYGTISETISLQFENIAKRFESFERAMEDNQIIEINQIVNSIDEMLSNMEVVMEEMPTIVIMACALIPNKIKEMEHLYDDFVTKGYPLDYLNVEYNIEEANKKINDILDRAKILNMEDSILELKVLYEYFEGLYNDFEKEKINRRTYEETTKSFKRKLDGTNKLVSEIFNQIGDIKSVYDLNEKDVDLLNLVKEDLNKLNEDYNSLSTHTGNNTFAYSKLNKELEVLVVRLSAIEEKLDSTLDVIGGMKEDEVRARQQLEEIKVILKNAKAKLRDYNLPIIPDTYFVELGEAQTAIKEIVLELDKKPITIEVLNTRVDTARDLSLKLLSKTKEMTKTAIFAEMAIVYGNRYRSSYDELDKGLNYSEMLFYKGEYQKSLESTINLLNKVEPGIYNKLLGYYAKEA